MAGFWDFPLAYTGEATQARHADFISFLPQMRGEGIPVVVVSSQHNGASDL
jgi:hypothetical protein